MRLRKKNKTENKRVRKNCFREKNISELKENVNTTFTSKIFIFLCEKARTWSYLPLVLKAAE